MIPFAAYFDYLVKTGIFSHTQIEKYMAEEKQTAFMEAYNPCHEAFTRYCAALTYGKMNTEDLVQDILLSAYENFDKISNKGQLLHYLIRAARNKSISHWRRSARYKDEFIDQHTEALSARGISAETQLDIQYLYKALDYLPQKQKEAVILYEINGFSMKEIAQIQNSNEAAIKNLVSRGRRKLRGYMEHKPKSRWMILLLGLKPLTNISNGTDLALDQILATLRENISPISSAQSSTLLQQGALSKSLSFQHNWMYQINLNHIIMSTLSLGSIITIGVLVLMPKQAVENTSNTEKQATQGVQITLPAEKLAAVEDIKNEPKLEKNITQPITNKASLSDLFSVNYTLPSLSISSLDESILLEAPIPLIPEEQPLEYQAKMDFSGDCITPIKVEGNIKLLKSSLLSKLRKDGLLANSKKEMRMTFLDNRIQINNQPLAKNLESKYLSLIENYNIKPCANRLIQIRPQYIAVGDMVDGEFRGRVNGRVFLDDLNQIKLRSSNHRISEPIEVENRPIEPFHTLKVEGLAVVHLSKGETKTARVEVSGMPIEDLITSSKDGILTITTKGDHNGEKIKVSVSTPTLRGIEVGDAAELYSDDTIEAKSLGIIVRDVGAAWLDVNTKSVNIMMSGGDLDISGVTQDQNVMMNGRASKNGTLNNSRLKIKD